TAAEKDEKGARTQEEETLETLNDLRLAVATARQRHESLEAQRQPMAAREAELVELIATRRTDIASYESKLAAQTQENRDDEAAFGKTLRAQLKRAEKEVAPTSDVDLANDELQRLIVDLTRQLDNMGPVNLDAVQEYDELEERYKFLESQNNDLTNSRRELLD